MTPAPSSKPRQITVVGAGIIGLTTAVELQRCGHDVTVVAEDVFEPTVSTVAGAVWFPFQVGAADQARVRSWALTTRSWMNDLAVRHPHAGIDLLEGYEIVAGDQAPWWVEGMGADRVPAPVTGAPMAWRFHAPRAQPALFLRYLVSQLTRPIVRRKVSGLDELPGDLVVNCTGLGARTLLGDTQLQALFGQVLITECGHAALDVTVTDHRDPESLFYVIPRRDELVLGGIARAVEGVIVPPAEPAITERVLAHAARLGIKVGAVKAVRVGLRPYRATIRLEREIEQPRILHNYGHGGSGFTLCHGAALSVADLVDRA
jgi:D-amino-acid oxidase